MSGHGVRLPVVTEHYASGETAQIYDVIRALRDRLRPGGVPAARISPAVPAGPLGCVPVRVRQRVLARDVKELIAAFVATEAGCQYCASAHSLLAQMTCASPQIVAAAQAGSVADMPVHDKLRTLMQFVSQIDHAADRVTDDDLARVRDRGWTDAVLLEAVWTACIFNGVVRLVDTFGLIDGG